MGEWQPIGTAPKDETRIDLWIVGKFGSRRATDCFYSNGVWHEPDPVWDTIHIEEDGDAPTHWMPQPQPPDPA